MTSRHRSPQRRVIPDVETDAWQILQVTPSSNYRRMLREFETMAKSGNLSATNVLASLYENGLADDHNNVVVKQSGRTAHRYNLRAAQLGDIGAITAVADRLARGDRRDLRKAITLYTKAYSDGYVTAAYNMACAYQNHGEFRKAVTWFKVALKSGDETALLPLALAELYGIGVRRNPASSFARLRRLSNSRRTYIPKNWLQTEAILIMADALLNGWLVRRNYTQAKALLRRAAAMGSHSAKAQLEFK